MPDTKRELYHLERLRALMPDIPAGVPARPEPPDFVWDRAGFRLGIEHTGFYLPAGHQAQEFQKRQSLRDQAIALAERLHHAAGGPALYLTALFHDRPMSQKAVRRVGGELARAVLSLPVPRTISEPTIDVPWNLLPAEIGHAHIHGSVDGVDRLWQAGRGGWVASITPDLIQAVIDRKERKISSARRECDELWLLIVNDIFVGAAPAELSEAALQYEYRFSFDRVLWLQPAEAWYRELRRAAAT